MACSRNQDRIGGDAANQKLIGKSLKVRKKQNVEDW
jgi:hypothetical protein